MGNWTNLLKSCWTRGHGCFKRISFFVKDALINKIGADIKVKTIRQIDKLVIDARKKIDEEINSLTRLKDVRLEFDSFVTKQKSDLNKTINDTKDEMNNIKDSAEKSVDAQLERLRIESDDVLKKIQDSSDVVNKAELDAMLSDYVKSNDFKTELDKKRIPEM